MPTYELKCTRCEKHIEVICDWNDTLLMKCQDCKVRLKQVFNSMPSVHYKGEGFYYNGGKTK